MEHKELVSPGHMQNEGAGQAEQEDSMASLIMAIPKDVLRR